MTQENHELREIMQQVLLQRQQEDGAEHDNEEEGQEQRRQAGDAVQEEEGTGGVGMSAFLASPLPPPSSRPDLVKAHDYFKNRCGRGGGWHDDEGGWNRECVSLPHDYEDMNEEEKFETQAVIGKLVEQVCVYVLVVVCVCSIRIILVHVCSILVV